MTDRTLPTPARELVDHLLDAGWQLAVITIEGMHGADQSRRVRVTWRTRDTGTLRLFSCLVGAGRSCHDSTLTKAVEYIRGES